MSLMGMNRAFKKHGWWLGGTGAALMLVVAISGLGANTRHDNGPAANADNAGPAEQTVATVGDQSVTRAALDGVVNRQLQQYGMTTTLKGQIMDNARVAMLDQAFKQQAALAMAAKAAGVTISDEDINRERDKEWGAQRGEFLTQLGLGPKSTDSDIDKKLAELGNGMNVTTLKQRGIPDDSLRLRLDEQGLEALAKKQSKITEQQVKDSYDEIKVRHILIGFGNGAQTEAAAKTQAEKLLAQVKTDPTKMPDLAKQFSTDPGSKANGGLYDWTPASKDVPAFSQAAIAAGVGKVYPELVRVVQPNYSGFHIIKSEGVRVGKDFPKDWDKNKQKYIDDYNTQQTQAAVSSQVAEQLSKVKVTVLDPGMKSAQALKEAQSAPDPITKNAKLNEALTDLNQIKPADYGTTDAPLRRADILMQLKRPKDAIIAYQDELNFHNSVDTRLSLADLYQGQNDKANALKQVQEAQKLPVVDAETQDKIATLLGNLGDAAGAKTAREKSAGMRKTQALIDAANAAAQKAALPPTVKLPSPMPHVAASGAPVAGDMSTPTTGTPAPEASAPGPSGASGASAPTTAASPAAPTTAATPATPTAAPSAAKK